MARAGRNLRKEWWRQECEPLADVKSVFTNVIQEVKNVHNHGYGEVIDLTG
jgi:hypothetical protein